MKNIVFFVFVILLTSCNSVDKKFLITQNSVGVLNDKITIKQLDSIYAKDSLVKTALENEFRYVSSERFLVFDKSQKNQLLELTPSAMKENLEQNIVSVQIFDSRFSTEKGINLNSTFSEIKKVYPELEVETLISTINVTPKGSSHYFVYDKKDLNPINSDNYTINDIPNEAKMTRFFVGW